VGDALECVRLQRRAVEVTLLLLRLEDELSAGNFILLLTFYELHLSRRKGF
jgi:hypothetical protein